MPAKTYQIRDLKNRRFVFEDRDHAGRILAEMLRPFYENRPETLVLGIPSGGVPVAIQISSLLDLPLDLLIIRKIPIPGNPEAGMGAITLSGEMFLNEELIHHLGITPGQIEAQIQRVRQELLERNLLFRQGRPEPDLKGKNVIIADDGLASGFTTLAAVKTCRNAGADRIVVAAPTGSDTAIARLSREVDEIFCANIRSGHYFAVAEAYRNWYDLSREEVIQRLEKAGFIQKIAAPA